MEKAGFRAELNVRFRPCRTQARKFVEFLRTRRIDRSRVWVRFSPRNQTQRRAEPAIHANAGPSFVAQTPGEHTTRTSIQFDSPRVVRRDRAEQCGLFGDLRAIADDHDLRVRGIEVAAGGGQDVGRG
jgi:hypothetical protein